MGSCSCESEAVELAPLDQIIDELAGESGALIPILQRAQEVYGYLPRAVLKHIAERTCTPLSQVFGVVTFYAQFYLNRRGKYIIKQCDGTACHVRGAGNLVAAIEHELGIKSGETTPDYQYTFEVVYCLGSCGLAPVAVVNGKVLGRLKADEILKNLRGLEAKPWAG